jgi:hypothetical protein
MPATRVLARMDTADEDYLMLRDEEDQGIREAAQEGTAQPTMDGRVMQRVTFDLSDCRVQGPEELARKRPNDRGFRGAERSRPQPRTRSKS